MSLEFQNHLFVRQVNNKREAIMRRIEMIGEELRSSGACAKWMEDADASIKEVVRAWSCMTGRSRVNAITADR